MKHDVTKTALARYTVSVVLLLSGCAATKETNPSKVNWYDLTIGSDRLEEYIKSRKQELARLEQQSSVLEQRLVQKKIQLQELGTRLQSAEQDSSRSTKELTDLNQEIAIKKAELESVLSRLNQMKAEERQLKENLAHLTGKKREVDERLVRYELEIEQLESEVVLLEKAIDRILLVRAKHALGES
nr:hypothetical protein [Nitrosomonas nitrosa]